jgi:hypothetical protein
MRDAVLDAGVGAVPGVQERSCPAVVLVAKA